MWEEVRPFSASGSVLAYGFLRSNFEVFGASLFFSLLGVTYHKINIYYKNKHFHRTNIINTLNKYICYILQLKVKNIHISVAVKA